MSSRLNKKAYKIIAAEITKAAAKDEIAGEISQKIALKRLRLLRSKKGDYQFTKVCRSIESRTYC